MAIVYGSYGQALDNFVSVQSVGSTDTFYFTIPWYKASYIEHINIWNSTSTAMTIDAVYILNNSAHYRYDVTDKNHIMWVDLTDKVGKAAQGYFVNYSINPVAFVENLYGRNYLEILVLTTANISNVGTSIKPFPMLLPPAPELNQQDFAEFCLGLVFRNFPACLRKEKLNH